MVQAIRTAMDSLNIGEQPNKDSPIRAGKIRMMRYSTLMDDWRRAISRWPKYKVMSTPPNAAWRGWRTALGVTLLRSDSIMKRAFSRNALKRHSGARRSRPTQLRSTAPKTPAAYARPMLARSCLAALLVPIAPHALLR